MRLIYAPSCGLLVAGMICLLIGLMVGIRSLFIIRESRGSLRGSGHAILAIVCSLLPFPVVMISTFMISTSPSRPSSHFNVPATETELQRASRASKAFDALVKEPPPLEWFKGPPVTRILAGPASVGEEAMKPEDEALLDEFMDREDSGHLDAHQVVRWAVHDLREKGTDVLIRVWFAQLNANGEGGKWTQSGEGEFHIKNGRILVGIYRKGPRIGNQVVQLLAGHYSKRMEMPGQ